MIWSTPEAKSPQLVSRLVQQCDRQAFAVAAGFATVVPDRTGTIGDDARPTITRDDFERWTRTPGAVEVPAGPADAALKRPDIDEVILVGGATRMPSVIERVANLFGKAPLCGINPDEVVALGAGVLAGMIAREAKLDDLVVTDVAPFSLGINVSRTFGLEHREGYYLPVIERNTTIPVSRVKSVATLHPNQTQVSIQIFQGEARKVEENLRLGDFDVTGIPRGPAGQLVDIRFTYDLNGVPRSRP